MERTRMRAAKALAVVLALLGSLLVGTVAAAPAQAATRDGVCDEGEICFYYNSDNAGSISDHGKADVSSYGTDPATCYVFRTAGKAGYNQCIKNNVASVWNRTGVQVRVHYNSGFGGAWDTVAAGAKRDLTAAVKNNNASHDVTPLRTTGTFQVPFPCGETWSAQTRTNHSPQLAVDFNHDPDEGWKVYASAAGEVTTVRDLGNTSYGKYIVITHAGGYQTLYAHLQSFNVSVGQDVSATTWIGRVGSTGGSTGPHLHYEQKKDGSVIRATFASGNPIYYGTKNLARTSSCPSS
ncbi:peptidoglycan DD-metalloendopeptidase family protein [Promicromonospora sp. NPDC050880]|uniref:peptidoglycan DD-metalloendopeptidase family protein n=1 Tax=Promicromonospora sp. NPDC050880 TaxID=3364406 RepID=UPI00378F00BA